MLNMPVGTDCSTWATNECCLFDGQVTNIDDYTSKVKGEERGYKQFDNSRGIACLHYAAQGNTLHLWEVPDRSNNVAAGQAVTFDVQKRIDVTSASGSIMSQLEIASATSAIFASGNDPYIKGLVVMSNTGKLLV